MNRNQYKTAAAFRRALEDRLKERSMAEGVDLQRMRRSVAFERLLCRLFASGEEEWILKGGYAMELRIQSARMTKDIDLSLPASALKSDLEVDEQNMILQEMLQEAAGLDLADFFTYQIGSPMLDLDAAPYGGARFPVIGSIAGKLYVRFHLDIGIGDVLDEPFENFEGADWLAFASIAPGNYRGLSREGQFAEKLHAYTRPRDGGSNSRVKDLIDMVLLIDLGLDSVRLQKDLNKTFARRKSHLLPASLEAPPDFWRNPYEALARECGLSKDIDEGFRRVSDFYIENNFI